MRLDESHLSHLWKEGQSQVQQLVDYCWYSAYQSIVRAN